MSGLIAKLAFKVFGENQVEQRFGPEDPWFDYVPATRIDGKPTDEIQKVKKALPPGISDYDAKILKKVKRRAWRLDACLGSCCGNRFGWAAVIGIVPFIGDAIGLLLTLIVIRTACKIEGGLPFGIKFKLLILAGLNFALGLIPFVGDIVDAIFKVNQRVAVDLERHLRAKGIKSLKARGLPYPEHDPSRAEEFDRHNSGVVKSQPSRQASMSTSQGGPSNASPTSPEQARTRDDGRSRSWFNKGSTKSRDRDVETGITN